MTKAGIQHINHQVESSDDVLRSFLSERRVPIVFGPGRLTGHNILIDGGAYPGTF
jgi:hypothetical protein